MRATAFLPARSRLQDGTMIKLNDLNISKKLLFGFSAVIAIIAASGATALVNVNTMNEARADSSRSNEALAAIADARFRLARQENSTRGWIISLDPYYLERIEAHRGKFKDALNAARALVADDAEQLSRLDEVERAADGWYDGVVPVATQLVRNPATRAQAALLVGNDGRADQLIAPAEDGIDALEEAERARFEALQQRSESAAGMVGLSIMGGMLLSTLLSVVIGFLLTRSIARPVNSMTGAMRKLAGGDKSVDIPAVGRKDEVGAMAEAVQVFKDAAIALDHANAEQARLEAHAAEERARNEAARAAAAKEQARIETHAAEERSRLEAIAAEERERNEAARALAEKEQAEVVTALAEALDGLARGDLTCEVSATFAGRYVKLRDDFNAAINKLREAIALVAANTRSITSGSNEISLAADSLSRRTETQAASLEETAAALDEITVAVSKTAANATTANSSVTDARASAARSGEIVGEAVTAMNEIAQSSRQISQIIGVIDEIAFQTNLLALNAGVEAARAGDAGRGFAVVASEVRALAQRSADAAKEIKALISASSTHVQSGVERINDAGDAISGTVAKVAEISALIAEIAASAREQSVGLGEVNTAINQMDQVTQQNAAMVEETTAASRQLADEANDLGRLVGQFKIAGNDTGRGRRAA